ncbi:hypothetical protein KIW84_043591 [Lathyrus oleraceus]|uniref:Uncharacterized protein n=1 Tax=Pisum sativum TaxID=3888 RepID=A0A9D4XHU5_PEA|nr:hypothetical protein KIW84_043591 [Pisum sativum]
MFTSAEWLNLNASKEGKGKKTTTIILQVSFWEDIVHTLKATGPLVKVLRLVDNEKKPAMDDEFGDQEYIGEDEDDASGKGSDDEDLDFNDS